MRRLPHGLVEAFKSTLEVVAEADLLVHVVDASAPDPEAQIDAVRTVLAEIGADRVPELLVFNKADLAPEEAAPPRQAAPRLGRHLGRHRRRHRRAPHAPSATGSGPSPWCELVIPYDRGDVLAAVHREGEVVSSAHEDAGVRVRARLDEPSAGRLVDFVVDAGHARSHAPVR